MTFNSSDFLSISEFSKLTGISRPNLIYYDKEGLLKPAARDVNNDYRKYHYSQMNSAYLLQIYRQVGLSLDQIRELLQNESITEEQGLLRSHIDKLDEQIRRLEQQKYNMEVYENDLKKYGNRDNLDCFEIVEMPTEYLTLSPSLRKSKSDVSTMNGFLMYIREQGMDMDCHIGRMFTKRTLDARHFELPEYVYFKKKYGSYKKKKGTYLIYTTYSNGSDINEIYEKALDYCRSQKYKITGNIFEDYPLSSILARPENQNLIRIMVPINHTELK